MKSCCTSDRPGTSWQLQSTRRRRCDTLQTPASETFFQLRKRCFSTGVWPRSAQVRCTKGVNVTPDSSTNTSRARRRATFFNPRPVLGDPGGDGRIVPLDRFELRLLARETKRLEDVGKSIDMIFHAVASTDDFLHPRTSPQIGVKPFRPRPSEEPFPQPFALTRGKLARLPRTWPVGQTLGPVCLVSIPPVPHSSIGDAESRRDGHRRPSLFQQPNGFQPSLLSLQSTSLFAHAAMFTTTRRLGKDQSRTQ